MRMEPPSRLAGFTKFCLVRLTGARYSRRSAALGTPASQRFVPVCGRGPDAGSDMGGRTPGERVRVCPPSEVT